MPEESQSGPFVQVACICQTVMQEPPGIVSLIRITDRVQVAGPFDQMQPQMFPNLALVVVLKSGFARTTHTVTIQPVTPSGNKLQKIEQSALFEGEDRGVVTAMPLPLVATEPGLYWFEVLVEDMLLTRIPLRVLYQKIPGMMPFQPPTPPTPPK